MYENISGKVWFDVRDSSVVKYLLYKDVSKYMKRKVWGGGGIVVRVCDG